MHVLVALAGGALIGLVSFFNGFGASALHAAPIVVIDQPGGGMTEIAEGKLRRHVWESDIDLFMIEEARSLTTSAEVNSLDDDGFVIRGSAETISDTFNSYLFFFDRVGRKHPRLELSGRITFAGDILGIMGDRELILSDQASAFYADGIDYADVGTLNAGDTVRVLPGSGNVLEFSLNVTTGHDIFRVLTAPPVFLSGGLEEALVIPAGGAALLLMAGLPVILRRDRTA